MSEVEFHRENRRRSGLPMALVRKIKARGLVRPRRKVGCRGCLPQVSDRLLFMARVLLLLGRLEQKGGLPGGDSLVTLPDGIGTRRLWKIPFLSMDDDSCVAHFPYLTEWLSAEQRLKVGGVFAKEVFHALELPYLKSLIDADAGRVGLTLMTRLMELGCMFARFTDDVLRHGGKVELPSAEVQQVTQAVLEQDEWRDRHEAIRKIFNKKQSELPYEGWNMRSWVRKWRG